MASSQQQNSFSVASVLTTALMFLAFGALVVLIVVQRSGISTYDQAQAEKRLKNLSDIQKEADGLLASYRWVDKNKGIVSIPIDRSIQLVVPELSANHPHPAGPISGMTATSVKMPPQPGIAVAPSPANSPAAAQASPASGQAAKPSGNNATPPAPSPAASPRASQPAGAQPSPSTGPAQAVSPPAKSPAAPTAAASPSPNAAGSAAPSAAATAAPAEQKSPSPSPGVWIQPGIEPGGSPR